MMRKLRKTRESKHFWVTSDEELGSCFSCSPQAISPLESRCFFLKKNNNNKNKL
jgi:hypothetical protein